MTGLPGLELTSEDTVSVHSTEARTVPMRIQLPFEGASVGSHEIQIVIESLDSPGKLVEKTTFLVPKQ